MNENGEEETLAPRPTISKKSSWDDSLSINAKKYFPAEIEPFAKATSTVLARLESRRKMNADRRGKLKRIDNYYTVGLSVVSFEEVERTSVS